jgi:hypothetical protein
MPTHQLALKLCPIFGSEENRLGPKLKTWVRSEAFWAWSIWAAVSVAGLCFVAIFSLQFPFGDEWEWMGRVSGSEPVTFSWLWSQHNEHRMFVPRLIYLGLGWLTNFDFRAGSFFSVFILSGLSFAAMATARKLRGQTRLYDAFFPLFLMHWGQSENLIWGFQLNFMTSLVLEGCILLLVARCGKTCSVRSSILLSLCLVLLGLCGSYGIVYLPPMVCFMAYAAFGKWRSGESNARRSALAMLTLAALPALLVVVYLQGLHAGVATPRLNDITRTVIQFMSTGIGVSAKAIWPFSGIISFLAVFILIKYGLTGFFEQPKNRLRAAGYLMFFGGFFALALSIGMGRGGELIGFEPRYVTLAIPIFPLLFFLCDTCESLSFKKYIPRALFGLSIVVFCINVPKGVSYSTHMWNHVAKYLQDMRDGVPPEALSLRYQDIWGQGCVSREVFATRLGWIQKAQLGPYRGQSTGIGQSYCVDTISPETQIIPKNESIRLTAGKSITQAFVVHADGMFRRIDVRMDIGRIALMRQHLCWTLRKIGNEGSSIDMETGCVEFQKDCGEPYQSIWVKNVYARKSERFELVIGVSEKAPASASAVVPLYAMAENSPSPKAPGAEGFMRGFVFLDPEGASASMASRRDKEGAR